MAEKAHTGLHPLSGVFQVCSVAVTPVFPPLLSRLTRLLLSKLETLPAAAIFNGLVPHPPTRLHQCQTHDSVDGVFQVCSSAVTPAFSPLLSHLTRFLLFKLKALPAAVICSGHVQHPPTC